LSAREIRASKFLSYVLRHRPEAIGLELDAQGWADVDELVAKAQADGVRLTRELVERTVETNGKQRFVLDADRRRIRANQGHSIPVDLGLEPVPPPDVLYHGTARRSLASIREQGLVPRNRQHVHLSGDPETARHVGQRHGEPVVLTVDAAAMARGGHAFYRSLNGVWLTDAVPPGYLGEPGA
jgi:putative RNA 2'-phosphotransferase